MRSRLMLIALAAIIAVTASTGAFAQGPKVAPTRYTVFPEGSSEFGYIPPPQDLSYLRPVSGLDFAPAASWDWRLMSGVTSVKNQNPYGTCWAFAALGNLEAKILIEESVEYDYSELNMQACNVSYNNCNSGGNAFMSTNYLAVLGSVEESCDPYPGGCPLPTCINPACAYYKQVTEWKLIPNDVDAIKSAIMTYGPVYTSMYAGFPAFSTYNGIGCLSWTGDEGTNHGVLIVGFDDDLCGPGEGGWIVKNSWGTSWGDAGFFYIHYGHARVGTNVNVITGYKTYNPNMTVYHLDDWGWWGSIGWPDRDDWCLAELTPQDANEYIHSLHYWATDGPTNYSLYVYDDFDGSATSNLLAGPFSGTVDNAGYYTIDMATPVPVTQGDPIYVVAHLNTPNYDYALPYDPNGPMGSNKSFISSTGAAASWVALDNGGSPSYGDVGLRATIGPEIVAGTCSIEGDPGFFTPPAGTQYIYPGEAVILKPGPANFGFVSTLCTEMDTFCVHPTDTAGWVLLSEGRVNSPCDWLDPGSYLPEWDISVIAPCESNAGDLNLVTITMAYCDVNGVCAPDCGDCEDPNIYSEVEYWSTIDVVFEVIAAPPALYILQDSLFLVEEGVVAAYIPFSICNGDPCSPDTDYNYRITSLGTVGGAINQTGTAAAVPGGDCRDVYGVINASLATTCEWDTLTIIAWDQAGVAYDTCVQAIHVIEMRPVPLFTTPVVTILVLAMILAAALILRRSATNRA